MMNKQELIEKVTTKEKEYIRTRNQGNKYSKSAVDALLEWYGEACLLFSTYISHDDTDFMQFTDKDSVPLFEELYDKRIVNYKKLMSRVQCNPIAKPLNNPEEQINDGPVVFISHSSKDSRIIKLFINHILKIGLGLNDLQIVCTSFEATGIEGGDNIPEYIRKNIKGAKTFLAMVSPNYKSSEICMNEVGAAWALEKKIIQIVLSETNFDTLCWLINNDKAIRIDDGACLDFLIERLYKSIDIKQPKENLFQTWNTCKADFLESLKNLKREEPVSSEYL